MQGQVLDFSIQTNEGIITAGDGTRYTFNGMEWKDASPPIRGIWVDFQVNGDVATGVYRALAGKTASTKSIGDKKKSTTTLLATYLGFIGAHKFYLGAWGWGLVYLLFCWTWIPLIISTVEGIRMVLKTDQEYEISIAEYFSKSPGPFGFYW